MYVKPQMKVTLAPVRGTAYTVHDGKVLAGMLTSRCTVSSPRRTKWHLLEAHATTTCKRCLAKRAVKHGPRS